jgi:TonB-dependent SusC/RagA subfamily outer membrane receptor
MWIKTARPLTVLLGGALVALAAGCGGRTTPPSSGPSGDDVAVGYGTQDREDMTGAIGSLTEGELEHVRVGRVEELLMDRVPGLQVSRLANGEVSLRIRGTRSFLGNNDPLVVVDGTLLGGSASGVLRMLSPQSIARIDVLKDAGATAVYGSRGANGVILITTKHSR